MPYKRGAPYGNKNRLKHGRYASLTLNLRRACRRALYEANERLADARMLAAQVRALKAVIKLAEEREDREKLEQRHDLACRHRHQDDR